MEAFGKLTGRTGGEFAGIFKEQGADVAILEFVAGLQRTIDSGENVHLVLEELGFDTVRIRDALLRSAGAGDLLTNAIQAGSTAWDENTALAKEASLRYSTMASQVSVRQEPRQRPCDYRWRHPGSDHHRHGGPAGTADRVGY